ncbi:hypothetical protein [Hyphomicrobium sp. DMF-1]|uniref:hypothetical protein n=1 Tax=Hyphomicrobium sp. DMF-1 TaxID=3019544 RepID=UPI0022EBD0E4|nr:hypothetical protein [Hyphomicrobium sp. DMF-1]WBT37666.1 hypothetical protein PE058_18695 [Hyphomicrobium sp. DMF-1]
MMIRTAMKALPVCAATLLIGSSAVSAQIPDDMKMTQAQCGTLWTQALAGSSGNLSKEKAKPYVNDFKKADKDGDKQLSEAEWTDACKQGGIQSSLDGAGDGMGGSDKTSDRTPGDPSPSRTPGATGTGAAGTEAGQTASGTSDRTPTNH